MKRVLALGLMAGLLAVGLRALAADSADMKKKKEALQELGEFIGEWNAGGGPAPGQKGPIWKETVEWGWRFKGDDCWLTVTFKDGKLYKSGEMRYLPDKKVYQLTLTTTDGKKQVFEGALKKSNLTMEYVDPTTKRTHQLVMNTAAEGVRFIYQLNSKAENSTIYRKDYLVQATRTGLSLGAKEKKNICIVSGGIGTSTVSYKGATYYVCCSGCRDAFNENPEKYIKEWEAKKGKK